MIFMISSYFFYVSFSQHLGTVVESCTFTPTFEPFDLFTMDHMSSIPIPPQPRSRRGSLFKERLLLPSPPIAFIGDSVMAKFNEEGSAVWEKDVAPLNAGNMGAVGDSTQNLVEKLERDDLPLGETGVVVLMIGATDLRFKIKVPVVFDQIRKIIMNLQARCRPGVKIVLLSILQRGDSYLDCNDAVADVNDLLSGLENGFTVRYVDLQPTFFDKSTKKIRLELFAQDLINLSSKGYEALVNSVQNVIKECLG